MSHPPDPKAYRNAEDAPPEHPSAYTAERSKRKFSHQQTKTAPYKTSDATERHSLLGLIFMTSAQSFNRTEKDPNENPNGSAKH